MLVAQVALCHLFEIFSVTFTSACLHADKGLYFTALVSFFFFLSSFRRLISEVTERILTKLGHIFNYDSYLKKMVFNSPVLYSGTSLQSITT